MAHSNKSHLSYFPTNRNPHDSNSPKTRGHLEYGTSMTPELTQQPPIIVDNIHQIPSPTHVLFPSAPGHELPLSVRGAYGFGDHPQNEPSHVPGNVSNVGGYGYRPGHDPPVAGDQGALYQPGWQRTQGHLNAYPGQEISRGGWQGPVQPSNPGPSHHQAAYDLPRPWNGETLPSFSPPTSPHTVYPAHHGREGMPPVDGPWSPQNGGYYQLPRPVPPPPLNHQHHQDHGQYSPQSTPGNTPPANGPFGHFHNQDFVRDKEYQEQGSGVDDATNSEMLGLHMPRKNCSCGPTQMSSASPGFHTPPPALGSDYTAHNSDHTQASTSAQAQVSEAQIDGPSRAIQLSNDVEAHFPDSLALKKLAIYILNQQWCELNEHEPPITSSEPVMTLKFSKRTPKSRFEPFFDEKLRCHVTEADGDRCPHFTTRRDRAVGHARAHFGFKPFACAGNCGKPKCPERYTCASFRNDHVGRKKNPKRPCSICQKLLTAQNLKRHMKQHNSAEPSQPTPSPSQAGEREEPAPKRRKLAIFGLRFTKK